MFRNPKLYWPGQFNLFFNMRIFIYSVLHGMASSLLIFFIPYGAIYMNMDHSGRDFNDYSVLAFTCFTALIIVVTGQIAFDTDYWTVITHVVIWGSLIFYFALVFIFYEGELPFPRELPLSPARVRHIQDLFGHFLRRRHSLDGLHSVLVLDSDDQRGSPFARRPESFLLARHSSQFHGHPPRAEEASRPEEGRTRTVRLFSPKESCRRVFPRTAGTRRSMRGSLRSGYAFSHQQGFGDLILKGKLFQNVEGLRG